MPFTFEDIERIEIEKRKARQKIIDRNRKIVLFIFLVVISLILALSVMFFFERITVGGI